MAEVGKTLIYFLPDTDKKDGKRFIQGKGGERDEETGRES